MVSLSKALIGLRMASFYAAEPPERVKKAQVSISRSDTALVP